jgi:4-diphosphocytidyl-2-C-methyl-D-erythritol kinase
VIRKVSPAKINLYLKVLRKRPDGYHDIASLMQKIDLADEMEFRKGKAGIRLSCPGSGLPEDSRNLVYRAAQKILAEAGQRRGVDIVLRKKIPTGAGLGGGSSNAATTLMAINELLDLDFGKEQLMAMGKKLGADVPFFIYSSSGGSAAWAFGIGEVLRPAENVPSLCFLLINPGFEVSTREVYEGLRLTAGTSHNPGRNFDSISELTNGPTAFNMPVFNQSGGIKEVAGMLHNDLESVTLKLHPELNDIKELLLSHGALGSLMSGSGPTVFGIFRDEKDASRAAAEIDRGSWSLFTARSVE